MSTLRTLPFEQFILIGVTGQTGRRLNELLKERAPRAKIVGTSRKDLDLEQPTNALVKQLTTLGTQLERRKKTALLFAAAYTNVEGCETDPEKCKRINVTNTIEVLSWAQREFDAKLVFYSTDYVFDGKSGPYSENVPRSAISEYGRSKVAVEEWIEANAPESLIVRTTGVFDYYPGSKNFLMQMLELWSNKKTTRIPEDQWANPVWAFELACGTLDLLSNPSKAQGIFNIAGGTQLRRSEFAQLIAAIFKHDLKLVEPVATSALGQKAKRPLKGGLDCSKLKQTLNWAPSSAREVLEILHARTL